MQSLKELYKIGNGPSSSHTMGPKRAAKLFRDRNQEADEIKIILYGSLALTGKGHLTDKIILDTLNDVKTVIEFDKNEECKVHPNTMDLFSYKSGELIDKMRVYSIGGGTIKIEGEKESLVPHIYPHKKFDEIKSYCLNHNIGLEQYVYEVEGEEIKEYLKEVWNAMENAIHNGLNTSGLIPGKLKIQRRAKEISEFDMSNMPEEIKRNKKISSYAYAVSEENASGGIIVTAPTCGAAGVLPATLYYMMTEYNLEKDKIIDALAVAGLIGNIVKENASISGAECGCQAEIGTACSMAAAGAAYLYNLDLDKIENSAEVAMEHHLGLTCDPVMGYVQIPCIERNGIAAVRALDAANLSLILKSEKKVSFDVVVDTMYETGKDLHSHYRETSNGGLAKKYCRNKTIVEK